MSIKSNMAAWLLPLLPFIFTALIFSSACQEPANDSQSYIPMTGVWEGTFGTGASVVLDLVEVRSDSIIGNIVISTAILARIFSIGTGIRTDNDSLFFQADTHAGDGLYYYFSMYGWVEDSFINGTGWIYPPENHQGVTLLAKRVQ